MTEVEKIQSELIQARIETHRERTKAEARLKRWVAASLALGLTLGVLGTLASRRLP